MSFVFLNLLLVADYQGVSWEGPGDVSRSVSEVLPEEPLYAVPRKDHQPKFTIDDFTLHKMLGKGSFGKVAEAKSTARSRACTKMWHLCHVTLYINIYIIFIFTSICKKTY